MKIKPNAALCGVALNPPVLPDSCGASISTDARPIWERIAECAESFPDEVFEGVPTDGASQHDHYLYGSPKK